MTPGAKHVFSRSAASPVTGSNNSISGNKRYEAVQTKNKEYIEKNSCNTENRKTYGSIFTLIIGICRYYCKTYGYYNHLTKSLSQNKLAELL